MKLLECRSETSTHCIVIAHVVFFRASRMEGWTDLHLSNGQVLAVHISYEQVKKEFAS